MTPTLTALLLVGLVLTYVLGLAVGMVLANLRALRRGRWTVGDVVVRSRCQGCGDVHLGGQDDAELWALTHQCKAVRS